MHKYKVSLWFGLYSVNPFISPSKVIDVESETEMADNEAILEALKSIGTYPRTYSSFVQKIKE